MEQNNNDSIYSWLSLIVVVIGTFMSILDSSIVNIAIPKIMTVFGVSMDDSKWILTSYTLALGAIIPLTGYLQDVFGSKRVYMFALTMFTIGSMLCGLSWNNTSMISFRILQAIGGGMIMPVGMSIVYEVFPREKIGLALGIWGIASMAAPAIGPTLGGYIIGKLDWRLIFNLNVPLGIIGVILAAILLKDPKVKKSKSFDMIGFLSSTIGVVSILYVLGEWSSIDWSKARYPILLVLGCLSLLLFVVNELTHPEPLLDLSVFKLFNFTVSQVITCVLTLALMGGVYVIPLFLQNIRGYTAMETGLIMFPAAIVVGILMPISGTLFDKIGAKPIVIPGLVILAISSYILSTSISMNSTREFITMILCVRSVGLGLAMMPINTAGMNAVPTKLIGKASALSNAIRQISSSLSITIMTVIIQNRTNYNYLKLSGQINVYNETVNNTINYLTSAYIHSGLPGAAAKISAVSKLAAMIQGQSMLDAMSYAVVVTSVIVIAAILLAFVMRNGKGIA
ncbi:MAG: DHA2 family efflux MFS transporter permease subunit [Clostridium sp.]|jgi:EmrB/QacA subfamily drug resistance transporter|uniref:DHA2 family efflux MFS transporter permease subunit n=1 Tax=Clostridium sp. TaxID=1506 RepID=UPI0025BBD4CE|nr:DHA2 family efflux MFS transporter permease subunit [Clostridium sp.]MCH3965826.1 DHA2 family efflux MFS transporter permease subunit [Clostridium sp.]MCI1716085.1 DHA2 family efflux MFS transporter permease subunit [Clostridium sp.]MCI1800243.1 DHA2 family efflux MFS transporter permease subunit [Clostridium sp.]MCI1814262.1 DHA2 family efflux MFS transporter permease subunit [Clostridium sp.]MCI1871161.1 DHA2 family efflux MFS transporter permease subunit [Clostridium sp.]